MTDVRERVWLTCLLDLYGPLLTAHRQEVLRMYCDEDLSLGEIAEQLEITRQGVSDTVNKARVQLEDYENKLGLAAQDAALKDQLRKCLKSLNAGESNQACEILETILKER